MRLILNKKTIILIVLIFLLSLRQVEGSFVPPLLNKSIMCKYKKLIFFLLAPILLFSQEYKVSGNCYDPNSTKKLYPVNIFSLEETQGVLSDSTGYYELYLTRGQVTIEASFVGFEPIVRKFFLSKDTIIDFGFSGSTQIKEVKVVEKRREDDISIPKMGKIKISTKLAKTLPTLGGEADIVKTIQLLPGVQQGTEGRSGMYVRGGGVDQNLVLVDGVPVYNIAHLMGFFSVFNGDAIESVSLNKGSFSAKYGGRLSSILDVKMKSGNPEKVEAKGAVGLISSRLTIDGPIKKGKSSFMVSARRTYPDLLVGLARKVSTSKATPNGLLEKWRFNFYDLYGKANFNLNKKNTLSIFGFYGRDIFSETYLQKSAINIKDKYQYGVTNGIASIAWKYLIGRVESNHSLSFYRYNIGQHHIEFEVESDKLNFRNFDAFVEDVTAKMDFVLPLPTSQQALKFGVGGIRHNNNKGTVHFFNNREVDPIDTLRGNLPLNTSELYAYLEDTWKFKNLTLNIGFRGASLITKDTMYFSPEPRLSMRYAFSNRLSLEASYSQMTQFVNLISNEGLGFPFDLWSVSSKKIKPQLSKQWALGMIKKSKNYDFSIEAYYKKMKNILSYQSQLALFDPSEFWNTYVVQGKGEAFGSEVFINKRRGKFTGWIGYTLSWNNRQFVELNNGLKYPHKFDRRHDLKIVLNYDYSESIGFSSIWVYGTGNAVSLPKSVYSGHMFSPYDNGVYPYFEYGAKNSSRAPNYHRLDLGVQFKKKTRWGSRMWNVGLYNSYARQNPYYLYVDKVDKTDGSFERYALFKKTYFTLIPSVSYQFTFK